jgi:hypothetical protein
VRRARVADAVAATCLRRFAQHRSHHLNPAFAG